MQKFAGWSYLVWHTFVTVLNLLHQIHESCNVSLNLHAVSRC